jgi:fatty-acyl-CoA synthase
MIDAILRQPVTTMDMISQALSRDLGRLVVTGAAGEKLTAGGFAEEISRYKQYFEGLEPKPKRAAILARNRIEVLYVSNGLNFAEIVNTALHPMGAADDYLYVLEDAGIDTLVFDADYYEEMAVTLKARAPGLRHLLALGDSKIGRPMAKEAAAISPRPLAAPHCDPEALFRIAYSGGTTGKPKGIMTTHRTAMTSALIQLVSWEWPDEVRHLICAPLSHSGAAVLSAVLVKGGSMVVLPGFDPVSVMQAIAQHRITSVLMVPTMVIALIDHPRFGVFTGPVEAGD